MSTVAKKEKMSVRHMLVVLTGIMITFGCSALCFSTWGLFQPVVAEGLGVETTAFAMYVTVMYLTMTVASPFMGKLLQTVDIRIILSVSACLVGGAFLLMSVSNEIWMFYLAAVLLGLGEISILWLAIPTLINRWFADKAGTFIGLCMAFTGIGGAVWSAVFTGLRAGGMDFHTIYLIWAVIALVTSLPFTLFCVRSKPEDCGLAPYGASVVAGQAPAKPTGLSAAAAMKTPAFYSVCVFAGLINIAVLIAMQFPTYTKSLTDVAFDVLVVGGVMTRRCSSSSWAWSPTATPRALWCSRSSAASPACCSAGSALLPSTSCTAAHSSSARSTPRPSCWCRSSCASRSVRATTP